MSSHHESFLQERGLPPAFNSLLTLNSLFGPNQRMNLIHKWSTLCDPSVTSSVQPVERKRRTKPPPILPKNSDCLPSDLPAYQWQPSKLDSPAMPSSTVAVEAARVSPLQPFSLAPSQPLSLAPSQPPLLSLAERSALSPEAYPPLASLETPTTTKRPKRKKRPAIRADPADPADLVPKRFPCEFCESAFDYKHVLMNHIRTHTGEKPYACPHCEKRFTRDHHLKTHIRLHTGEKPFECRVCGKCFVQVANLRRHERVHTGERPFQCRLCSSKFSDSNQLKAHALVHTDIMPYSCETCGQRFRRKHHGKGHVCGQPVKRRSRKTKVPQAAASGADNSASSVSLSGTPSPPYSAPSPASNSPSPASGTSNGSSHSLSSNAANNNNNNDDHNANDMNGDFGTSPTGNGGSHGSVKIEENFFVNFNGYHFLRSSYAYWPQFPTQFADEPPQEQPEDLSIKK